MSSANKIVFVARISQAPERLPIEGVRFQVRTKGEGAYTANSVPQTYNVTAYGKTGESCWGLTVGRMVCVEGRVSYRKVAPEEFAVDITADTVSFLGMK